MNTDYKNAARRHYAEIRFNGQDWLRQPIASQTSIQLNVSPFLALQEKPDTLSM